MATFLFPFDLSSITTDEVVGKHIAPKGVASGYKPRSEGMSRPSGVVEAVVLMETGRQRRITPYWVMTDDDGRVAVRAATRFIGEFEVEEAKNHKPLNLEEYAVRGFAREREDGVIILSQDGVPVEGWWLERIVGETMEAVVEKFDFLHRLSDVAVGVKKK